MVKVVIISDWFAEKMGYAENLLPKAMAKLPGVEVHVITTDLQPAFNNYKEIYEPFIGPRQQQTGVKKIYNYTLHRLPHGKEFRSGGIFIKNLRKKLKEINPDIVQCFNIHWMATYQAGFYKYFRRYKFFLEDHTHLSVFDEPKTFVKKIKLFIRFKFLGRWLASISEICYPIAPDVAYIVHKYYGYPKRKLKIVSLGVDTDIFSTTYSMEKRNETRKKLNIQPDEIVCVYSGRLSDDKKPLLLAKAINELQNRNERFRAIFIGSGTDAYKEAILKNKACTIIPFVQWFQLAEFYQAADIGVWPSQESTSQLDAASCGLPLILSNKIHVKERVEGNGLLYEEDNYTDLAEKILQLKDYGLRKKMGSIGSQKVEKEFSWNSIAADRINDYYTALKK